MNITEIQNRLNDILYKVPDVGILSYDGFTYFRQVWSDPRTGNGFAEIELVPGKKASPAQLVQLTAAYIETALKHVVMKEVLKEMTEVIHDESNFLETNSQAEKRNDKT